MYTETPFRDMNDVSPTGRSGQICCLQNVYALVESCSDIIRPRMNLGIQSLERNLMHEHHGTQFCGQKPLSHNARKSNVHVTRFILPRYAACDTPKNSPPERIREIARN